MSQPSTDLERGSIPSSPGVRSMSELVAEFEDDVVLHINADGVSWASPDAMKVLGVSPDDLLGTPFTQFVHPDDRPRCETVFQSHTPTDAVSLRVRMADGSFEPCLARIRPIHGDGGVIVRWHSSPDHLTTAAGRAFATLAEGTRVLLRSQTEQELLQQMCDAACRTSGYSFAWYGLRVQDKHHSVHILAVGGDDHGYTDSLHVTWDESPTGQGPTGQALRTGRTHVVNNLAEDPRFAPWRSAAAERGIECSVALPVWCDGELHGAFMVYASQKNVFDTQAVELLEYLAADIGYGLSRLRGVSALAASEERFRLLAENASDVVFLTGPDLTLEWVSPSVTAVTGWTAEQLLGERIAADYLHPDDARQLRTLLASAEPGVTLSRRLRLRCADGNYRWMSISGRGVLNRDGSARGRVVAMRDIQDQVEAEEDLRNREQQYRLLAENAMDLVLAVSAEWIVTWVSPSVRTVLGFEPAELVGQPASIVLVSEDAALFTPTGQPGQHSTHRARFRTAGGQTTWMEATLRPVIDDAGRAGGRIIAVKDVDDQVHAEELLRQEVAFDALTGMAKKTLAITRIQEILDSRSEPGWALICVGVRGMRAVNQAFTYEAGDAVLRAVAARLVGAAGAPDRVARIAGDEFVVMLRDVVTPTDAADAAERLIAATRGPVQLPGGAHVEVSTYVGVAPSSTPSDAEELLRDATTAMRMAGDLGPDRWTFLHQNLAERSRADLDIQRHLREALADGQVTAWFMPIVGLNDDVVRGYEALVRWVRPDGTVLSPPAFLEVAERSHLILDIDRVVLERALAVMRGAEPGIHVAVNISAATLQTGQVDDIVLAALDRSGGDPRRLHLEVTETALFQPTAEIVATMHALAHVGISWWVDDFGTGYSSISHLRDLPIAGLKLDRSFTANLVQPTNRSRQLAQGLVGLAHGLGLSTIAEGVETQEQAQALRDQGWELGQGWLYGKPAPLG